MPGSRAGRVRPPALAAIAALIAGTLLYAPTASNDFVFDDVNIVQRNPLARDPADLAGILSSHYWRNVSPTGNLYRPLTIWSFALNHRLTGEDPAGHHLTNAALHGLVSGAVVLLGSAFGLGAGAAAAAGLLFAAHPVHVEAVAPVVGRSELLAALFVLSAWLLHLRASRGTGDGAASAGRRWPLIAGSAVLFAAGLLSKENAAVLPALILCGDLVTAARADGRWRARLLSLGSMMGVLLIWLAARGAIVPGLPPDDPMGSVFGGIDPWTRILTATGVLGRYLVLLIFPLRLSADYSYHQIPLILSAGSPLFLASAAAHVLLALAGFLLAARRRLEGLAILIYLGALFPVSNLPFSVGTVMGERLLYLPSVGACLLCPALYHRLRRQGRGGAMLPRLAILILVPVLGLYGARVLTRIPDWRDAHSLFTATVRTSPGSAKAHYNLGVAEDERGRPAAAMAAYREAVRIKPDMVQAQRNLGLDLLRAGRPAEAAEPLGTAARLDPNIPDIYGDLGVALFQVGRTAEAREAFRREIDLRPESGRAHYNLGTLLLEEGKIGPAIEALSRAASLDPLEPDIHAQLGHAAALGGLHLRAAAAFRQALSLDPSLEELLLPLARSALAAGRTAEAREAVLRAREAGLHVPADLEPLLGP